MLGLTSGKAYIFHGNLEYTCENTFISACWRVPSIESAFRRGVFLKPQRATRDQARHGLVCPGALGAWQLILLRLNIRMERVLAKKLVAFGASELAMRPLEVDEF